MKAGMGESGGKPRNYSLLMDNGVGFTTGHVPLAKKSQLPNPVEMGCGTGRRFIALMATRLRLKVL